MKKIISLLLVIAMTCALCISVSAAALVEHPVPPSDLCSCDYSSMELTSEECFGVSDYDTYTHTIRQYDVYKCSMCDGYEYRDWSETVEAHYDNNDDGECDENGCEQPIP